MERAFRRKSYARLLVSMAALLVCLTVAGAAGVGRATSTAQTGTIVFSVFGGLPAFQGNERCEGLYAVEPDGTQLRRLVVPGTSGNGELYPSLAPGGRMLSFATFTNGAGTAATLYGLNTAEGAVRQLAQIRSYPLFLRFPWSPRAPYVLLPGGTRRLEIERLDARSGRLLRLTAGPVDLWPTWSPDGAAIAFTRRSRVSRAGEAVWLMAANGTRERRLATRAHDPVWSPDGHRLAFFRTRASASPAEPTSIWVIGRGGGKARRVAGGLQFRGVGSALWSPRGDTLLVLRKPSHDSFPGADHGAADAYELKLATGRSRLLARHVIPLGWFADGILYLRGRFVEGETVFEIRIVKADGSASRLVGVVDEEDVNIGSYPARQLHPASLTPAVGEFAPSAPAADDCLKTLARFVRSLR